MNGVFYGGANKINYVLSESNISRFKGTFYMIRQNTFIVNEMGNKDVWVVRVKDKIIKLERWWNMVKNVSLKTWKVL
jgi:hypothetical protein